MLEIEKEEEQKRTVKKSMFDNDNIIKPSSYVGFDSIQQQFVSKIIQKGFSFNIMVVGLTGIGKSTFINSLFNIQFPDHSLKSHALETVQINDNYYIVQEGDVKLRLGIIETQGFGDQINKEKSYEAIIDHIDKQFIKYFNQELKIDKHQDDLSNDTRVHVCIYLISPNGCGLAPIDLITMKQLQSKVNIIPIVAKVDSLTKHELSILKQNISNDIKNNNMNVYDFDTNDNDEVQQPFGIVSSNEFNEKNIRSRKYCWGTIEIDNKNHNDFRDFRENFFNKNIEKLIQETHLKHYENYRRFELKEMGFEKENNDMTFIEFFKDKEAKLIEELKAKEDQLKRDFAQKANIIEEMHRQNLTDEKSKLFASSTSFSAKNLDIWRSISGFKNKKKSGN